MDEDLRRGLLKLSSDVLQGTMRAAEAIEPSVTPTQLRVLSLLADDGSLSVSAVASALGVAVSTASRLADRLSGAGLLARQVGQDSRREVELALTRRGRLVAGRWADARVAVLGDLVAQLEGPARELVEAGLRSNPPLQGGDGVTGPARSVLADEGRPSWRRPADTSVLCFDLSRALAQADPHTVPDVLVAFVGGAMASSAVTLRVVSPDGRVLRPVSWTSEESDGQEAGGEEAGDDVPDDEPVDRSPAGQAVRSGELVVEADGLVHEPHDGDADGGAEVVVVHAPLRTAGRCTSVVTVRWQPPTSSSEDVAGEESRDDVAGVSVGGVGEPPTAWLDLLEALVTTAGLVLPAVTTGSRRMHLAARTQEWTVAAEVQTRQSGPACVVVDGLRAAAHTEPSASGGAEAHDLEVVTVPARHRSWPGGRAGRISGADGSGGASATRPTDTGVHLDVAVLDCRSRGRHAAGVTGLALGALRHARSLGLDPAEQARLVDQAVFGEYRGEVLVDVLLLRVDFSPWRVHALASSGATVHRQRGAGLQRMELDESEPLGLTGENDYRMTPLDLSRGERVLLIGDGFGPLPPRGRRRVETVVNRSRGLAAAEVVRHVITDLLDLAGADGPEEDATIVCVDL